MAGIAALMSKRKKQALTKRSDTELALQLQAEEAANSEHHPYTSGLQRTDSQTPSKLKRASAGALKPSESKEWSNKFKQSTAPAKEMAAVTTKDTTKLDDGSFETNPGPSYSAIYIGLVLVSIGMVITFVGLGEKGFKTVELKLIGPTLCAVGFVCVIVKIISCNCPEAFTFITKHFERKKPSLVDQSNALENGTMSNGHLKASSNKSTPQILSPRVTLHSSKKTPRPRSTIPNYIEDSSDEDDFDPGRTRAHTNHQSSQFQLQPQNSNKKETPEIVLTPKSLML